MKELSIEEKAKAYDETLDRARKEYKTHESFKGFREILVRIFPELAMSEDEKIREKLLSSFKDIMTDADKDELWYGLPYNDIIAWLEKQGEPMEINPTEFDTRLQALIGKFDSLPKEELIGSLSFWMNVVQNDGTYKPEEKQGEQKSMKTCAEYYNQDNELKMPELSEFQNKLADILMYREYDGPDETEEDIAKGRLEYELAAIRLSEELLPLAQKEQKPADKVKPKFHKGDWVVFNNRHDSVYQVEKIENYEYTLRHILGGSMPLSFSHEDMIRAWTIQDAKDCDILVYKDEISLYKHDIKNCTKESTNFGGFVYHCCYDGKRFITDSLYSLTEQDKTDIHPATKEQRDILMKVMAVAGYTFDFEKKELKSESRVIVTQKPSEWSEEDNIQLQAAINICKSSGHTITSDWLKSLKERIGV